MFKDSTDKPTTRYFYFILLNLPGSKLVNSEIGIHYGESVAHTLRVIGQKSEETVVCCTRLPD